MDFLSAVLKHLDDQVVISTGCYNSNYDRDIFDKLEKIVHSCQALKRASNRASLASFYDIQEGIIKNYILFLVQNRFDKNSLSKYFEKLGGQLCFAEKFKHLVATKLEI